MLKHILCFNMYVSNAADNACNCWSIFTQQYYILIFTNKNKTKNTMYQKYVVIHRLETKVCKKYRCKQGRWANIFFQTYADSECQFVGQWCNTLSAFCTVQNKFFVSRLVLQQTGSGHCHLVNWGLNRVPWNFGAPIRLSKWYLHCSQWS